MNDEILTKADLAKRQKRSLSSITTACSKNPSSIPPYFKLGTDKNSPIRFRLKDVIAWENNLAEMQQQKVAEHVKLLKPRWII